MKGYAWPGNVRELRNVLERSVILSLSHWLPEQWLPGEDAVYQPGFAETNLRAAELPVARDIGGAEDSKLDLQFPTDGSMGLEEMQSEIVGKMLARYNGNVTEVARTLKTTPEKIRYRIEIYHLR